MRSGRSSARRATGDGRPLPSAGGTAAGARSSSTSRDQSVSPRAARDQALAASGSILKEPAKESRGLYGVIGAREIAPTLREPKSGGGKGVTRTRAPAAPAATMDLPGASIASAIARAAAVGRA